MCEQCNALRERNTTIKRAATNALFCEPLAGSLGERALTEVPGFSAFLELARRLEAISRLPIEVGDGAGAADAATARELMLAMTPEGRTDVLRIASYVRDMADGIYNNIADAKVHLRDTDGWNVAVMLEEGDIVVRLNGEEVSRAPLAPEQDPSEALDAAERAMQAHREHYE